MKVIASFLSIVLVFFTITPAVLAGEKTGSTAGDTVVRAVAVFTDGNGGKSAMMSADDMNTLITNMFSMPLFRYVSDSRQEQLVSYVNFYNADGTKWTVWFNTGWPSFLDAYYGDEYSIWRSYNGDAVYSSVLQENYDMLQKYEKSATGPWEPSNKAKDALILPEDKDAAEIIKQAVARNIMPIGYLDDGLDQQVTRAELQELIIRALNTGRNGISTMYVLDTAITDMYYVIEAIDNLLYSDNALIYADIRNPTLTFVQQTRIGEHIHKYPYANLALYIGLATNVTSTGYTYLPDVQITNAEAAATLNTVVTLFTGKVADVASAWLGGAEYALTRFGAVSAALELCNYYAEYREKTEVHKKDKWIVQYNISYGFPRELGNAFIDAAARYYAVPQDAGWTVSGSPTLFELAIEMIKSGYEYILLGPFAQNGDDFLSYLAETYPELINGVGVIKDDYAYIVSGFANERAETALKIAGDISAAAAVNATRKHYITWQSTYGEGGVFLVMKSRVKDAEIATGIGFEDYQVLIRDNEEWEGITVDRIWNNDSGILVGRYSEEFLSWLVKAYPQSINRIGKVDGVYSYIIINMTEYDADRSAEFMDMLTRLSAGEQL